MLSVNPGKYHVLSDVITKHEHFILYRPVNPIPWWAFHTISIWSLKVFSFHYILNILSWMTFCCWTSISWTTVIAQYVKRDVAFRREYKFWNYGIIQPTNACILVNVRWCRVANYFWPPETEPGTNIVIMFWCVHCDKRTMCKMSDVKNGIQLLRNWHISCCLISWQYLRTPYRKEMNFLIYKHLNLE